jgi:hypothetical protein
MDFGLMENDRIQGGRSHEGHADLFSKSRITLLWLEEQPALFTIRPGQPPK